MTDKYIIPHMAAAERKLSSYNGEGNLECEECGTCNARKNRQRTYYPDDASNWTTLCPSCQEINDEYWDDMWAEYYASVM